ncbi:hypothetical protein O2W15_02505 [Modestobacter sp. VKM Ac-2979]|uniref:hypothetical protein n=1 Tax=unclassified Modestobacter TaxID=2643866 RepID=UPI0022AB894A|nr:MULTISPECIES: hypothetical protein [unclassified Modestobacter]MCZ2810296.1 hypothetical protein [Modestobacter sp. VKM Ac-2979]MCZ2841782.1 hypothetical protein [Modestobacter sp. VKM Ac-2980]
MSPDAAPTTPAPPRPRVTLRDPWTALRVALVLGCVVVALATVLVGQRPASLEDLRAAVDAGRVEEVRVSEGLGPRATGSAVQTAVWRSGLVTRRTEVWQVSPSAQPHEGSRPVVTGDLADQLRTVEPGLRVGPLAESSSSSELLGWRAPVWVGALLFVIWLAALFLLVGGPVPERATRWAWFWLCWIPLGTPVFLVLSGPFPGVPAPRPGARRLTGGWAFLLSWLVVGAVAGS